MFSKESGKAIAVIKEEGIDNKILYIKDDEDDDKDIEFDFENADDNFYKAITKSKTKNKLMSASEVDRLKYYLERNIAPYEDDFRSVYEEKRNMLIIKHKYEINLGIDQRFEMIPPLNETIRLAIAGMTGSGKSTQARNFIKKYHSIYPNNKVFMFSRHKTDPVYDELDYMKRIDISPENIIDNVLDIELLKNSLVVFDDVDKLQNAKVSKAIFALIADIYANGRHYNISTMTLLHKICDGPKTKDILSDINGCMLFLNGTKYGINYFLKRYGGLDANQIKQITSLKSRWFYISLECPQYILSEYKAFILK